MTTTRVLVVDDHPIVRAGIRRLLENDAQVEGIGEAATLADALAEARRLQPTLVILDVVIGATNALEVLPQLQEAAPGAKVLVLSMYDDPAYVRQALRAGARGYVLKDAITESLVEAMRQVCAGGRYLAAELAARVVADDEHDPLAAQPDPLSAREREVTQLLALGHTNREIAARLDLSLRTVEAHRASAMHKLEVHGRAELVRYALSAGLIHTETTSANASTPLRSTASLPAPPPR